MKRVIAISLLIIFMAGQVNLTWADHFCMSFKVQSSVMLGHGELDCGMGEMMACDEDENDDTFPVFKAPSCCSNDYYSSDADDNFFKASSLSDNEMTFLAVFAQTFLLDYNKNIESNAFVASSPPLIYTDKQVLYQTFLL